MRCLTWVFTSARDRSWRSAPQPAHLSASLFPAMRYFSSASLVLLSSRWDLVQLVVTHPSPRCLSTSRQKPAKRERALSTLWGLLAPRCKAIQSTTKDGDDLAGQWRAAKTRLLSTALPGRRHPSWWTVWPCTWGPANPRGCSVLAHASQAFGVRWTDTWAMGGSPQVGPNPIVS